MKLDVHDLGPFSGTIAAIAVLLFLALRIRSRRLAWAATLAYFAALVISLVSGLYIGDHGVDWRWSRSDFEFVQSRALDVLIAGCLALVNLGVGVALSRRLIAATRSPL